MVSLRSPAAVSVPFPMRHCQQARCWLCGSHLRNNVRPLIKSFSTPRFRHASCELELVHDSKSFAEKMERKMIYETDLINLKDTELRLGLPGSGESGQQSAPSIRKNKRASPEQTVVDESTSSTTNSSTASVSHTGNGDQDAVPQSKALVVGWPPIRSYRRNCLSISQKKSDEVDGGGIYVKVSMDGAPYLRKMDLKVYKSYSELLMALENMFQFKIGEYCEKEGFNGSDFAPTYEDKDGDWMLVGDVPWEMFISSCKRLRIMKGSEARGLGCL